MGCLSRGDADPWQHKTTATLSPVQGLESRSSLAKIH